MSTLTKVSGFQSNNIKNKNDEFANLYRRADMDVSTYYEDCEKVDFGAAVSSYIYDDGLSIREEAPMNVLCPIVYNRHLLKSGMIYATKWLKELKAKEEEEVSAQLYFIRIEDPEDEDNTTYLPTVYNPLSGDDQLYPVTLDVLRSEFRKYIEKNGKPNPKHWTLEKYVSMSEKGEVDNWDQDIAVLPLDPERDFEFGRMALSDEEAEEINACNREIEKDFLPEHLIKKNWRSQLSKDGVPEDKLLRDVIYFRDYKTFQVRVLMDELCKVMRGKDRLIWNTWMRKNPGVLSDKYYTFIFQTEEEKDKACRWFGRRYFSYQTGGRNSLAKVKWLIHQRAFLGVYGFMKYNSIEWKNFMSQVESIYGGSEL